MTQAGSKPLSFPPYRRSHFRSETYLALVRIFSGLPPTLDDGDGRMEQEKSEKGSEFSEFVGSTSVDPKDPVPEKIIQKVHETTKEVRDKGMESGTNDVVLRDIEPILEMDESGEYGSVLMPGNNEDKQIGSKSASHMPTNNVQSQVLHKALLVEEDKQYEGNSSASKQKVNISDEKKHGPSSEEKKAQRKQKKRKNQAEKNKQLDVKRLKLPPPAQKPKTITYCRHYLVGRCHQGDKCKFSHDTEPMTKSTPCRHFARRSCMKGNNCPFDHELSKYPCDNFVSRGFCSRGDACLFSHQVPPKEDGLTPSGIRRPELKSTRFINSIGICSHNDPEDTITAQKHAAPIPRGIRFLNIANAKSSLPGPSTPGQGLITPNKNSLVQIGACFDQSAVGTHQTSGEIPKKFPAVAPKGANFLCFGKGSMCSFESSISSLQYKGNDIKVPLFVNFGLSNHAGSSLQKDDCNNCNPICATIASPSMLRVSQFGLQ